jgi:hypothetical protein
MCRPGFAVYFGANVPGTSEHMEHVSEHHTSLTQANQPHAASCQHILNLRIRIKCVDSMRADNLSHALQHLEGL